MALFYGNSMKKEKEKSKREEENGDRKINTLIIRNGLFSGPSSFLALFDFLFLDRFPAIFLRDLIEITSQRRPAEGDGLKEYILAEAESRPFAIYNYMNGKSSLSIKSLIHGRVQTC